MEIIIRNPKKIGSSGLRLGLGMVLGFGVAGLRFGLLALGVVFFSHF